MVILQMKQVTEDIEAAFARLIPQLTQHSPPPKREMLAQMAASDQVCIFLAREEDEQGHILGTATLATFLSPTGRHGWIEDVVVDRDARRRGIGRALTRACLEKAQELGLGEVNLTSRPGREGANAALPGNGFSAAPDQRIPLSVGMRHLFYGVGVLIGIVRVGMGGRVAVGIGSTPIGPWSAEASSARAWASSGWPSAKACWACTPRA